MFSPHTNWSVQPAKWRLDRAFSLRVMQPASRLRGVQRKLRIPILMYHGIRPETRAVHPYYETNTSPAQFELHMRFLSERGYQTVDLETAMKAFRTGNPLKKCVVITFDDGYKDFYTEALPVLTKLHFQATIFVVPGFVTGQLRARGGEEYMSWNEIRQICAQGMQVGSHTMTHPQLHSLGTPEIEEEIQRSKNLIEDKLGMSVRSFAYPFAFPEQDRTFVRMLRHLMQVHEYREGVCTIIGRADRAHDHFFLPRLPINTYDDVRFFEAKLNGGYDWLHRIQYPAKLLKARFSR